VVAKESSVPLLKNTGDEPPFSKELKSALAWQFPVGQLKLPNMHLAVFSEPPGLQIDI